MTEAGNELTGADREREELRTLVADLVGIQTENPPGNEAPCAHFVRDWFEERGVDATLVAKPYEERPQVTACVGTGQPRVVLNGHMDVVPPGDLSRWNYDPYGGEVVDGELYGRGSVDMKTGLALGMVAAVSLRESVESGALDGSIVFQAAIGEETGEPGTRTLLEEGYGGDFGVVLEPTGMKTATSEKGLAWYEITVRGEPSHASRPDAGENAIANAVPVVDAVAEYDEEIRHRTDELVGCPYATITQFDAGIKENVVPDTAKMVVDRRMLPRERVEDVDREIDDLLAEVASVHGLEIECERIQTYESAAIDPDHRLAEVFREESEELAHVEPEPWGTIGSTDVRNFVNDAGMPAITWGPGDTSQEHTIDEHVDLERAYVGLDVLESALHRLLS